MTALSQSAAYGLAGSALLALFGCLMLTTRGKLDWSGSAGQARRPKPCPKGAY